MIDFVATHFAMGRSPYDDFAVKSGLNKDYIMYIMVFEVLDTRAVEFAFSVSVSCG